MNCPGVGKSWFSAADLAHLALPGLPRTKRKLNDLATAKGWALQVDRSGQALARPRAGRGGGLEFHVSLLPPIAQNELVRRGIVAQQADPRSAADPTAVSGTKPPADQMWSWFDRQPDTVKAEAQRRQRALETVEALERSGQTRTAAIAAVAAAEAVSKATIWSWISLVAGVRSIDRLPRLAPHRNGGGAEAEIHNEAWLMFKSDYLRPERPTFSSCWHRVRAWAEPRGIAIPHVKTFQRRLEREVDGRVIIARRQGVEALRAVLPPQQRTVAGMEALELVNIDGHKWDVFVRWPDGRIARPMMVAIQDIMSRKFLGWRVGQTESVALTRLAFADVFRNWGVPQGCLLDNGRAFASKAITGGAKTRFRFSIRPEDPTGLLTALGVEIHWATPYRGQSKPIERGFRDLCDAGAKHPAFAGAYTGNRPDAKPENYGNKAIELDVFIAVINRVMAAHNARPGRRTETARGGSFDQAFEASYARSAIRRATAEQMRMALLAADQVSTDRKSGAINFHGNRYWNEALAGVAGDKVTIRFDPDDLHRDLHVYGLDGRYLCDAEAIDAAGFLDMASAKARARQEAELRRKTRELEALEGLISADRLAAMLPDDDPGEAGPSPAIIRPVRIRATAGVAEVAISPKTRREAREDAKADAMAWALAAVKSRPDKVA